MAKPNSFKAVIEALEACIAAAPDKQKDALAQALEDYASTYGQSYRDLYRSTPAMRDVIGAIAEASEAKVELP